ncbi:MAG: hypothetical protein LAO77_08405 [Acidobacteriia bacterium]|nr:hypothetical protein [Terriglobia bacterium]
MIGKTIGQYEIQSLLGQGGMGEVYQARDSRLGRREHRRRVFRFFQQRIAGIHPWTQPYFQPRISPDGRQLAVAVNDGKEANIWVYDLSGTTSMRRLTFAGKNRSPIWTRDGQRVVFTSDREGDSGLFWQRADGSGEAERLPTAEAGVFHTHGRR